MLDRLIAKELQAHFPCGTIGQLIIVLEQTGSTNDAILQVATGVTAQRPVEMPLHGSIEIVAVVQPATVQSAVLQNDLSRFCAWKR